MTCEAGAFAGEADVLAREAAADEVGGTGTRVEGLDVAVAGDAGPVPRENPLGVGVAFALPDRVANTCAFESQLDAADA
jgi:hypothetical protein